MHRAFTKIEKVLAVLLNPLTNNVKQYKEKLFSPSFSIVIFEKCCQRINWMDFFNMQYIK